MELTTERLLLREFVEDDWQTVQTYQADPRYLRYYDRTDPTEEDARAFIRKFLEQQRQNPRYKFQLALVWRDNNTLIGNCGVRLKAPGSRNADMGFELNPDYWGQGIATEAAQAMLNFGFGQLGLHRIDAWCVAENRGSARVLEKLGMRLEGRMREHLWIKGAWYDTLLYGMLDREWEAQAS